MGATSKKIFLTRHAEGAHNANEDEQIYDALLTAQGEEQCAELHRSSERHIQQKGELIVCSPLRRTMQTMLLSYPSLIKRLESEGKPPILLDIVQEVKDVPSDTPSYPVEKLKNAKDGMFKNLDFSTLSPDYASKEGIYDPENVKERAREVRRWLRSRDEQVIVVVAHGDILRCMVDGDTEQREWDNCEVKTFTFESENDDEANMIGVPTDVAAIKDTVAEVLEKAMEGEMPVKKEEKVVQEIAVQ